MKKECVRAFFMLVSHEVAGGNLYNRSLVRTLLSHENLEAKE